MIYELLHWLFGWDYVHWKNSASQGIARVHLDGMGRVYYWRYWSVKVADIICEPKDVIWLTCPPAKYGFLPPQTELKR